MLGADTLAEELIENLPDKYSVTAMREIADKYDIDLNGVDDFLYSKDSITLIEWGDKIKDCLDSYIEVDFKFLDLSERKLGFKLIGHKAQRQESLARRFKAYS